MTDSAQESYSAYLAETLRLFPKNPVIGFEGSEIHRQCEERREILRREILGFPAPFPVQGIVTDTITLDSCSIEKLIIQTEAESWQTALLYLPVNVDKPIPAIILASGHGGSKSNGYNQLAAQIYARLGCAAILPDPIGEEERNAPYGLGLRGHRADFAVDRLSQYGRPFLGKVVYDLSCCVDYLRQRREIDPERIGCAGSSMGGTTTQLLLAVDTRLRAALVSSWTANYHCLDGTAGCCFRLPGLIRHANQIDLLALAAPHCAVSVCSGEQDEITPPLGLREMVPPLRQWWKKRGAPDDFFACEIEKQGGHRPFHITIQGLKWMSHHLGFGKEMDWSAVETVTLGSLFEKSGNTIAPLYNVERHHKGTCIPDFPVEFLTPEQMRVLNSEVLQRVGLRTDHFTLQGYLEKLNLPSLEHISATSHPAAEARKRVEKTLSKYVEKPFWFDQPLPQTPMQEGEIVCANETFTFQEWHSGFCDFRLYVYEKLNKKHITRSLTKFYLRRSVRGVLSPKELMQLADGDERIVLLQTARCNDNEVLLGQPSLITNLFLVQRSMNLLKNAAPYHLVSEIPRLGELTMFFEDRIRQFTLLAQNAVEPSQMGNGRAESILPYTRDFHWLDLFRCRPDCKQKLNSSYFTEDARKLLMDAEWKSPETMERMRAD